MTTSGACTLGTRSLQEDLEYHTKHDSEHMPEGRESRMTSEADDYLRSVHPRDTESSKTSNTIPNMIQNTCPRGGSHE